MTPPAHQFQSSWSSNQTMYEAQGSSYSSGPHRNPIGAGSPFSMHPRTPEVWNGPMGPTSYSFSSNPSRGGHLPSPGFGPRGSQNLNSGQGRGQWVSHSPGQALALDQDLVLALDQDLVLALDQEEVGAAGMAAA
jgi:hypothetical protein